MNEKEHIGCMVFTPEGYPLFFTLSGERNPYDCWRKAERSDDPRYCRQRRDMYAAGYRIKTVRIALVETSE